MYNKGKVLAYKIFISSLLFVDAIIFQSIHIFVEQLIHFSCQVPPDLTKTVPITQYDIFMIQFKYSAV